MAENLEVGFTSLSDPQALYRYTHVEKSPELVIMSSFLIRLPVAKSY